MVDYNIDKQLRDRLILKFRGAIKKEDEQELKEILAKSLNSDYLLVFNMEDVTEISNNCMQLLCHAHRVSTDTDKVLMLCGIKEALIERSVEAAGHTRHTVCDVYGNDGCVWTGGCHKCDF